MNVSNAEGVLKVLRCLRRVKVLKVFEVFGVLGENFKTFDTLKSLCSCKLDFGGLMSLEMSNLPQIETQSSPVYTIKHIQTFQSYSKVNTNATG